MVVQELFSAINKIDTDLKYYFENVKIEEATNKGKWFFEIKADNLFFVTESLSYKRFEVVLKIEKQNLNSNNFRWSYSTNPLNEKAMWIERNSTLETFAGDVYSIVSKKMMDEKYFEYVQEEVTLINENSNSLNVESIDEKIKQIVTSFVSIDDVSKSENIILENNSFLNKKPDFKLRFLTNDKISEADKFKMETDLKKFENVNFVSFRKGEIEVDITP
jgi:hypothetical protein